MAGNAIPDIIDFASKTGDFTIQSGFTLGGGLSLAQQFEPTSSPVRLNLLVHGAKNRGRHLRGRVWARSGPVGQRLQCRRYAANRLRRHASIFRGGVSVVIGDVNGDGVPDVITAAGPAVGHRSKCSTAVR